MKVELELTETQIEALALRVMGSADLSNILADAITRQQRIMNTEKQRLQLVAEKPKCPKCGHAEITANVDAYAQYNLLGFDEQDEPVLSFEPDGVNEYDDVTYCCNECCHDGGFSEFFPHDEEQ